MQIKSSLKQLWVESRANPGFTSLYIGGVAFAVAFTMVFTIIYYVHLAPIYPEYSRNHLYHFKEIVISNAENGSYSQSSLGQSFIDQFITSSDNYETATITCDPWWAKSNYIYPDDKSDVFKIETKGTDEQFFKVYDYEFLAGHPYTAEDIKASIPNIVINSYIATRLFGSPDNAIGKDIRIGHESYHVVGVVREGTAVATNSFADVFIPYTIVVPPYYTSYAMYRLIGSYNVTLKFRDSSQHKRFKQELDEKVHNINISDTTGWQLDIKDNPTSHAMSVLTGRFLSKEASLSDVLKPLLIILLVLLVVPAINISGMICGQMDRKMSETGIRRSFGATRSQLTWQVMFENFVLTLAGGTIGLIIAWCLIVIGREWLLSLLLDKYSTLDSQAGVTVSPEMLFGPLIFLAVLFICLVLNLLSAYLPVHFSLRKPIVSSLNTKR